MSRLFLSVGGRDSIRLAAKAHLYLRWRGPSLGVMSWVFSPVVVVGQFPVLAGGFLSHCGHRFLLSFGTGLPSSSGGDLGLLSNCGGTISGGSLRGQYSVYLWHWGLLSSFHGVNAL